MNDIPAPSYTDFKAEAHRDPASVPLHEIDVSNPYLYSEDTWHGFFARLRREDPVHFVHSPMYGPFWSVTFPRKSGHRVMRLLPLPALG